MRKSDSVGLLINIIQTPLNFSGDTVIILIENGREVYRLQELRSPEHLLCLPVTIVLTRTLFGYTTMPQLVTSLLSVVLIYLTH